MLSYVQSCPLEFTSLRGAPSQEHKTQLCKKASCFRKLWLTFKELSVSNFPCLKYKQMNRSCCKTEIFTHPGPHLGHLEINESILMSWEAKVLNQCVYAICQNTYRSKPRKQDAVLSDKKPMVC